MSKPIKVEDHVYRQLDDLRGKGETFSDVIDSLLAARLSILQMINVLEGTIKYREWQLANLQKVAAAPEG